MAEDDTEQGFLNRWARRKAAHPEAEGPGPEAAPAAAESEDPPLSEEEIVAQLPDIDSLDETSDFTPFLQQGVPDLLRRKALRVLWRSNPVFANLDGMNEYDEDYTLATSALQAVKTAYQVGKGFITDEERAEMDADSAAPAGDDDSPAPEAEREQATTETAVESGPAPVVPEAEADSPAAGTEDAESTGDQVDAGGSLDSRREPGSARNRRWGA